MKPGKLGYDYVECQIEAILSARILQVHLFIQITRPLSTVTDTVLLQWKNLTMDFNAG